MCIRDRHFLVDSGADISVFPVSKFAANGSKIDVFGKKSLKLRFPGLNAQHSFHVAAVQKPILGPDFFINNNLVIDLPRGHLLCAEDGFGLPLTSAKSQISANLCCLHLPRTNQVESLLDYFPELLVSRFGDSTVPPKHGIRQTIPTTGPPIYSRPRRLMGEKLEVAKKEFQNMLDLGIMRTSNSPWSSPLHVVAKANGGWRPCGDYCRLNVVTNDDRYPYLISMHSPLPLPRRSSFRW